MVFWILGCLQKSRAARKAEGLKVRQRWRMQTAFMYNNKYSSSPLLVWMHDAYTRNKLEREQKYIVTNAKHHALKFTFAPTPLHPTSQFHSNTQMPITSCGLEQQLQHVLSIRFECEESVCLRNTCWHKQHHYSMYLGLEKGKDLWLIYMHAS